MIPLFRATGACRRAFTLIEVAVLVGVVSLVVVSVRPTLQRLLTDGHDKDAIAALTSLVRDADVRAATAGRYGVGHSFDDIWAVAPGGRWAGASSPSPSTTSDLVALQGTPGVTGVVASRGYGYVSVAVEFGGRQMVVAMRTAQNRCAFVHTEHGTIVSTGALSVPSSQVCAADGVIGATGAVPVTSPGQFGSSPDVLKDGWQPTSLADRL